MPPPYEDRSASSSAQPTDGAAQTPKLSNSPATRLRGRPLAENSHVTVLRTRDVTAVSDDATGGETALTGVHPEARVPDQTQTEGVSDAGQTGGE